jgi:hypothetical protein
MPIVGPFWMVSDRKKAGHREFWYIFPPFYRKDVVVGWYYNV